MIRPQIAATPGGVLFLADAPDAEAEVRGVPMCGPDGFLLQRALRMANLTNPGQPPLEYEVGMLSETRRLMWERRAHSFAYVLPEALPRNADFKMATARADQAAMDELNRLIDVVAPNVIVTLGDLALWSVTGENSSEQWRGAPRLGKFWGTESRKIFPTYPLDRVQQQYKLFGPLVADLMKVSLEAQYPEVRPVEIALWLEPELDDLRRFHDEHIARSDLLSIDIETAKSQIVCVQIGTDARTAIVVPFVDYRKSSRNYWATETDELAAWDWLDQVLRNDVPKLGQNFANYDAIWLLERMGLEVRNYRHDLRLMHHILQPELPKALAFMGSLYTSLPRWKSDIGRGTAHGGMKHSEDKRDA